MSPAPDLRPRLTLRIGVTGHRPNRLDPDAQARVAEAARAVLDCLSAAATSVQANHAALLAPGAPDLRLVTALAEGADTILATAAREAGIRLDVILPFPRATYAGAQAMGPEARAVFADLMAEAHRVLELHADPQDAGAEGYLAAGRRMLAHADLLVTVWDGAPAAGLGGTAQIVGEAVETGIPVIWIQPDGAACLVTEPAQLVAFDRGTPVRSPGTPCVAALTEAVRTRLTPPAEGSAARKRLEQFVDTPTPTGSSWCVYGLLRHLGLGRRFRRWIDYRPDPHTEAAWTRFRGRAEAIGGGAFAGALKDALEARWRHADALALHCSHAYRSSYVANFGLAGLAVATGLLSVFWWSHTDSVPIKAGFVGAEVLLIGVILWLTRQGGAGHNDWHARWIEARAVAELLRPARLPALIGDTAAPPGELGRHDAPDAWVEWYVRATLREIGPPSGVLDDVALRTAIHSAIEDEIDGQIAYNRRASHEAHDLDHWLHVWGERLFIATLCVGLAYLGFGLLTSLLGIYPPSGVKEFIKALTTCVGGSFPAFGAALFGMRATGDFMVASEQARRTLGELEAIKQRLELLKADPSRELESVLLGTLTGVLAADLRDWAKIYRLRQLILPG